MSFEERVKPFGTCAEAVIPARLGKLAWKLCLGALLPWAERGGLGGFCSFGGALAVEGWGTVTPAALSALLAGKEGVCREEGGWGRLLIVRWVWSLLVFSESFGNIQAVQAYSSFTQSLWLWVLDISRWGENSLSPPEICLLSGLSWFFFSFTCCWACFFFFPLYFPFTVIPSCHSFGNQGQLLFKLQLARSSYDDFKLFASSLWIFVKKKWKSQKRFYFT